MNLFSGVFWVFLAVYHEARGESDIGQKNVVKVILNRAAKHKWPVENIVRARKQFSCFNAGLGSDTVWIRDIVSAATVAKNVHAGIEEWHAGDRLFDATHYYAPKGMKDGKPPYWASSMTRIGKYGNHIFFRED